MVKAVKLAAPRSAAPEIPAIGVYATSDHRIDKASRARCAFLPGHIAGTLASRVKTPQGGSARVVYSEILVDNEVAADAVARQFKDAGVGAIVCAPDSWSFPQLTSMSLLAHFPKDIPFNVTCGNSGPRPGVVYAHALTGALAQTGRLTHLNVGTWPDTGPTPEMTPATADALVDWCQAALAHAGLKGRRVAVFGHDSMGMETALAHVLATRRTFGLEITRFDMKHLADLLVKKAYDAQELKALRAWIDQRVGKRLVLPTKADSERFNQSLAMYLIVRDAMKALNAVGGGFMSQLEWGSDPKLVPLPVADVMESLFNSTFDHNGPKAPLPYATESDMQALLTMLYFAWLSGGQAPLFMDFRKVWEPWEIKKLADSLGIPYSSGDAWAERGFFDGNNSGSASFDWAGKPGARPDALMANVRMPLADPGYFPGGGNSVTFRSPGGIKGLAGRMAFSDLNQMFSLIWDEAETLELPDALAAKAASLTDPNWPHTFVSPKYGSMAEFKQYAPANHIHMVRELPPARLQYWMDMAGVLSVTPWAARPSHIPGVDRPAPLIHLINGGEAAAKRLLRP